LEDLYSLKLDRIHRSIDIKQNAGSGKRMIKLEEPARSFTSWDWTMQQMKYMQEDFSEEKKWKKAMAYQLAHEAQDTYLTKVAEKNKLKFCHQIIALKQSKAIKHAFFHQYLTLQQRLLQADSENYEFSKEQIEANLSKLESTKNYPKMIIPQKTRGEGYPSLHNFVQKTIALHSLQSSDTASKEGKLEKLNAYYTEVMEEYTQNRDLQSSTSAQYTHTNTKNRNRLQNPIQGSNNAERTSIPSVPTIHKIHQIKNEDFSNSQFNNEERVFNQPPPSVPAKGASTPIRINIGNLIGPGNLKDELSPNTSRGLSAVSEEKLSVTGKFKQSPRLVENMRDKAPPLEQTLKNVKMNDDQEGSSEKIKAPLLLSLPVETNNQEEEGIQNSEIKDVMEMRVEEEEKCLSIIKSEPIDIQAEQFDSNTENVVNILDKEQTVTRFEDSEVENNDILCMGGDIGNMLELNKGELILPPLSTNDVQSSPLPPSIQIKQEDNEVIMEEEQEENKENELDHPKDYADLDAIFAKCELEDIEYSNENDEVIESLNQDNLIHSLFPDIKMEISSEENLTPYQKEERKVNTQLNQLSLETENNTDYKKIV
jgi:hypothetical protein